ncbi:hypothetical protein ACCS79_03720 [Rhizobium johnstonii]|uniref:hypothetical protein n=1 Tax=Rhizobium johnstonii TaxID=3019933 RepID=UPI003F9EB608
MTGLEFRYEDNVRAFKSELDGLGKQVFPRIMARLLNRSVTGVKRTLDAYTQTTIDRPNAYTRKAWSYTKARPEDGDKMSATIQARPDQAQYLWFVINGGTRTGQEVGGNRSPNDLFAWTAKVSPLGGIDRKYRKKLSRQLKAEKKKRALYAGKRRALAAQGLPPDKQARRMAKLHWSTVGSGDPGIFYGVIHGVEGYWQRPERYTAEERLAVIGKARSRPTRPNVPKGKSGLARTRAGSKAKLLVAVARQASYKPTFDYTGEVTASFAKEMTQKAFDASMTYEVRRAKMLSSGQ